MFGSWYMDISSPGDNESYDTSLANVGSMKNEEIKFSLLFRFIAFWYWLFVAHVAMNPVMLLL